MLKLLRFGTVASSTLAILLFVHCTDSDPAPTSAAGDAGGSADGSTPGSDSGSGGSDGGAGLDGTAGNDGSTTSDGSSDATTEGGSSTFTVSAPVSVFAVPIGFAGTTTQHVLVASASGIELRALAGGAPYGDPLGVGVTNNAVGAVAYQQTIPLGDGGSRIDDVAHYFNATTHANSGWLPAPPPPNWGFQQILSPVSCSGCTYTDLAVGPVQVPPNGHVVLTNSAAVSPVVRYMRVSTDGGSTPPTFTNGSNLKIADAGFHYPVTATQRAPEQHGLVVAVPADAGTTGQIFVHDRTNSNATHVGAAGTTPKMVRCADAVCVVTNSGSNNVTVFTWDGQATIANLSTVAVGTTPQGVDIKKSGTNYVAVVANSSAGTANVLTLSATASVVSNSTVTLAGCANPRSVSHVPGTATFAVACTTDNKIVVGSL